MHALIFQAIVAVLASQNVAVSQVTRHASAIEAAVEDDDAWLPFKGQNARAKTALLLVALADHESGLRASIEFCYFESLPGMTQDNGKSVGLCQAYQGPAWYGHSHDEICGDAELQFKLALRYLNEGMKRCHTVSGALSHYNANVCRPTVYSERVSNAYNRLVRRFL